MQKLGLDDGSAGCNQINSQGSRRLEFQSWTASQEHAMTFRDANCSMTQRLLSHANACKLGSKGGPCASCKRLIALNFIHKENKCPVPFSLNVKFKKHELVETQILKNSTMDYPDIIKHPRPVSSKLTCGPSPECLNIKRLLELRMAQSHLKKCRLLNGDYLMQNMYANIARGSSKSKVQLLKQRLEARKHAMTEAIRQKSSGSRLTIQVSPANKPFDSRFAMNITVKNHSTALIRAQQHMQKRTSQATPGAPNQMMGTRNVANWDTSKFSQNIQPQSILPGQPMSLILQSQMIGVNSIPIPFGSGSVKLSLGMATSETSASAMTQKSSAQDLQLLTTSFGILELSSEEGAASV